MNTRIYYKNLRMDLASWHDKSFFWSTERSVEVKEAKKGEPCGSGLHLAKTVKGSFVNALFPCRIFEAKRLSPILGEDDTKVRVKRAKLIREVTPNYVKKMNDFIESLRRIPWCKRVKKPLKSWKIFDSKNAAESAARDVAMNIAKGTEKDTVALNAMRGAAWNAALNAARDEAWRPAGDVAWGTVWHAAEDIIWDAAWSTVKDTVQNIMWDTDIGMQRVNVGAEDVVGNVAWVAVYNNITDVSQNAARDAVLYAATLIGSSHLDIKYVKHAASRIEVWKRGYALLCDINGELFVYQYLR